MTKTKFSVLDPPIGRLTSLAEETEYSKAWPDYLRAKLTQ